MLLPILDDLKTYELLFIRYLTLNTELKRIEEINIRKRSLRTEEKLSIFIFTTSLKIIRAIAAITPTSKVNITPDR